MNMRSYRSVTVASIALWVAAPLFAGAASREAPASRSVPPPPAAIAEKAPAKTKKKTATRRYYTMEPTFADSTAGDYTVFIFSLKYVFGHFNYIDLKISYVISYRYD
jgi:hypothetical protein